jgi:cation:H+ antiporter
MSMLFETPLFYTAAIVIGFLILCWSADQLIDAAIVLARHFKMPTLLIGILIVGFGTSLPELAVSLIAAYQGTFALSLGNVIGSNIANIGLILGLGALISPIALHSNIVKRNIFLSFLATLLIGAMLFDARLSMMEGMILIVGCIGFIIWTILHNLKNRRDAMIDDIQEEIQTVTMSLGKSLLILTAGIFLLVLSSELLVWGAIGIAKSLGVSDLVIGLSIVAIGTSLPELATSLVAIKKDENDIVIGNIVGSNLFNLLGVIGTATLVAPLHEIASEIFYRDWSVMFAMSAVLFFTAYGGSKEHNTISRLKGAVFLLFYLVYLGYLAFSFLS